MSKNKCLSKQHNDPKLLSFESNQEYSKNIEMIAEIDLLLQGIVLDIWEDEIWRCPALSERRISNNSYDPHMSKV